MVHDPMVSVCMAIHNASRYLCECIDSILAQSFRNFELLVVDDGSSDNSIRVVESYADSRIRIIRQHHNFIDSLNTLLDEARGEYLARMDADDIMLPDRLSVEVSYLDKHPDVDAVCSNATRIDTFGNKIGHIGFHGHEATAITPKMMCESNQVCNNSGCNGNCPTSQTSKGQSMSLGMTFSL